LCKLWVKIKFNLEDQQKPFFTELFLFSEESLLPENCGEMPCFFGDYPTKERYLGQKTAFLAGEDYENYKLETFNNRKYFVNFLGGAYGNTFEYTTFIGDTKIDIWIQAKEDQKEESDTLMETFIIE